MKGIVAEKKGKYAVILTQDGQFKKVRALPDMSVGMETEWGQLPGESGSRRFAARVASMAAVGLLVLGVGYGAYSYTVPYSYVDIDINPSIELTVNIYDRIIGAEALNDDGRKLLLDKDLRHKKLDNGVTEILNSALEYGYLRAITENEDSFEAPDAGSQPAESNGQISGEGSQASGDAVKEPGNTSQPSVEGKDPQEENVQDSDGTGAQGNASQPGKAAVIENAVMVTVSSNNSKKSVELKKKITNTASKELDKDKVNSEILVGEASNEQREAARKVGVTPGKLALIEDALKHLPERKLEDVKNTAVKDLLEIARENKKAVPARNAEPDKEKGRTESNSGKADSSSDKTGGTENNNDKTGIKNNPVNSPNDKDEKDNTKNSPISKNKTGTGVDSSKGVGNISDKRDNSGGKDSKDSSKNSENGNKGNQSNKKNDNNEKKQPEKPAEKPAEKLKKEREELKDEFLRQIEKSMHEDNKVRAGQDGNKKAEGNDGKKNNDDKKKSPGAGINNGTGNGVKGKGGSRK